MQSKLLTSIFAFLLWSGAAHAQQILSGLVTNAQNKPMSGVFVTFKGFPAIHTETDFDGKYRIKRPYDAAVVVFNRTGLSKKEVKFDEESLMLNVVMENEAKKIDTLRHDSTHIEGAMGVLQDRHSAIYAYQQITGDELVQTGEYNIIKALSAKVAGLEVTSTSGMPGSSASAVLRGRRFMNSNNAPLVILDGMPLNNAYRGSNYVDFANRGIDMNVQDIESATILKGASAAALYGIDASNGAIVLKSKTGAGNTDKMNITFEQGLMLSQVNALPELQHAYAQGEVNTDGNPTYIGAPNTKYSWGPKLDSLRYAKGTNNATVYAQKGDILTLSNPKASDASRVTPFYNPQGFFKSGVTYNTHLGVSGTVAKINYRGGLGYLFDDGVVPSAFFRRYTAHATANTTIFKGLDIMVGGVLANSSGRYIQKGNNPSGVMFGVLQMPITFDLANGITQGASGNPSAYEIGAANKQRTFYSDIDNPYWSINNNVTTDNVSHANLHAQANYEIFSWLKALYRVGVDRVSENRVAYWNAGANLHKSGLWDSNHNICNNYTSDALLLGNFQPMKDWLANVTVGYQYRVIENKTDMLSKEGFTYPNFPTSDESNQDNLIAQEGRQSTFYNLHLQTKNTMYYTVTGRMDWSSTFGKQFNPSFYDSYGMSLVFTELLKISDRWLPYGRLRFSYANVGGGSGTPYLGNSAFVQAPSVNGLESALPTTVIGDAAIQPKKSNALELGLDVTTLDGKIRIDLAAYTTTSKAEVVEFPVSAASGATTKLINGGKIQNKGIEATISSQPMTFFGIEWNSRMNFSLNRSKVVEIGSNVPNVVLQNDGFSPVVAQALVGQPLGVLVGTRYQKTDDGRIAINNEGYPVQDRLVGVIGNPAPDWLLGWRNTYRMDGFTLSFLMDVRAGGSMFNGTVGYLKSVGMHASTEKRETPQVIVGTNLTDLELNKKAALFNYAYYGRYLPFGIAESNMESTSWVRLRDISLFYALPKEWLEDMSIRNFSIGIIARNPFLLTKYTGIDPETNLSGISNTVGRDYFNNPNTKSWGFQFRVGF
jgi:TonB-linked SusC/RagA family outer membrane protein